MQSIGEWWLWTSFFVLITIFLSIDLFLFAGRRNHHTSVKESVNWVLVWFTLAILFNIFIWFVTAEKYSISLANNKAIEFITAYLLEESLSLDNLFVFIMIFKYFSIPVDYQRRLLLFGVLGAIIARLLIILAGIWLIRRFDWIFYIFGLILIFSSIKMLRLSSETDLISNNIVFKILRKFLPISEHIKDDRFIIRQENHYWFTPLFIVLIFVEISDLIFAVDSIPAVFAVTSDPFIAFTSNAFAILGLRALFFVITHFQKKFAYLDYGLALMVFLVGMKLLLHGVIDVPVYFTFIMVLVVLVGTITFSKFFAR